MLDATCLPSQGDISVVVKCEILRCLAFNFDLSLNQQALWINKCGEFQRHVFNNWDWIERTGTNREFFVSNVAIILRLLINENVGRLRSEIVVVVEFSIEAREESTSQNY
jgi:hypothetical protein